MPPTSRRGAPIILRGIAALAAIQSSLHAHGLLRATGQAVIESNRVVVTFDVSAEDFQHLHALAPSRDGTVSIESIRSAARAHADELTALLELWDQAGERLLGEPFRWEISGPPRPTIPWMQLRTMRIRYHAAYGLPTRTRLLTLRMDPAEQSVALARQWVIDVRGCDAGSSQTVQLTSRGNAEIVELEWSDLGPHLRVPSSVPNEKLACAPGKDQQAARHREIFVDIEILPEALDIRVTVPLPLLSTWLPVRRRVEGRVEPDEQAAVLAAAQALMRAVLDVDADGKPLSAASSELSLVGTSPQQDDHPGSSKPVGYFASHLEIHQRMATPNSVERWSFVWRLMNSAVVSARVAIHDDGQCAEGDFSSYAPKLVWEHNLVGIVNLR